jgi:hypothetical protein
MPSFKDMERSRGGCPDLWSRIYTSKHLPCSSISTNLEALHTYIKASVHVFGSFVISSKALPEFHSILVTKTKRYSDKHLTPLDNLGVLTSVVERCLSRLALRSGVTPRHTAIDYKVGTVDEAALVAGKEK